MRYLLAFLLLLAVYLFLRWRARRGKPRSAPWWMP